MLDYQIAVLDKKLPYFLEHLNLDATFFAHVHAEHLLGEEAIEEVKIQDIERKKILKFVDYLKKQAPLKFNVFLRILKSTQQDHIFKEINYARQQKIKHLPKSPDVEKNTQKMLQSDFYSHTPLITSDREYLEQHFVSRADYDEINEDKHILQNDNEKLLQTVEDLKDQTEYEMKHHQLVKDEYNKIKEQVIIVKLQCDKHLQNVRDLKFKLTEQAARENQFQNQVDELQCEVAALKQELLELKSENTIEKNSNEMDDLTLPSKNEKCLHDPVDNNNNTDILQYIQHQLEMLQNSTLLDEMTPMSDLYEQLANVKNTVVSIMSELQPANNEQVSQSAEKENTLPRQSESQEQNVQKHQSANISQKPKTPKHSFPHKEKKRVIILETELHDVKNRLKKTESEKEEQNLMLQEKEKQLREEQRQVTNLRLMLRRLKSQTQFNTAGDILDTSKTNPVFPASAKLTASVDLNNKRNISLRRQQSSSWLPNYSIQTLNFQVPRHTKSNQRLSVDDVDALRSKTNLPSIIHK